MVLGCVAIAIASGASAQDEPGPRDPDRAEARRHLQEQLDRIRERERWLTRQIESFDRGEPESLREGEEPRHRPEWADSPEERLRLLGVLRDLQSDPELAGIESPFRQVLETEGPERDRLLRRLAPRLQNLVELKGRDPERYEAGRREMVTGIKIARAARLMGQALSDPEASKESIQQARGVLRATIADGFDARAANTRLEVLDVQAKLDSLNEEVARAEAERESRIDEQLEAFVKRIEQFGKGPGADRGSNSEEPRDRSRPSRDD